MNAVAVFCYFAIALFPAVTQAARQPGLECGEAALIALNKADGLLYRWTRPLPQSGSFSVGVPVYSSRAARLLAMDDVSGDVFVVDHKGFMWLLKFSNGNYNNASVIGSGWSSITKIVPAGNGVLYAVTREGALRWYRWRGSSWDPTTGTEIGSRGWNDFTELASGGNGVLYGIRPDGSLAWYRNKHPGTALPRWLGPKTVGSG